MTEPENRAGKKETESEIEANTLRKKTVERREISPGIEKFKKVFEKQNTDKVSKEEKKKNLAE